ncbi:MAG: hypothetical protein EPN91_10780 [Salinibacterium sp.]|nr:MAG: hypothetical protein EPN91_10780 [Salinibacterium sp.]
MTAPSRPVPIDDLRCPKCRRHVVWTVHGGIGHLGTAYCSNGRQATRMASQTGPYCRWEGQRVVRRADNEVYAVRELRDLNLTLEACARGLFLLGYRDGLERLKAGPDDDKPEPCYLRGLEQGRAERAARVRDERIARRSRP